MADLAVFPEDAPDQRSRPVGLLGNPWVGPPEDYTLGNHEVHVWSIGLESSAGRLHHLEQLLSPAERQRAGRFRFASHRSAYIAGHALRRKLLGRYLGMTPESLHYIFGPCGKPAVSAGSGLTFSYSTSNGQALLAVARRREVGIDIEYIREIDIMQVAASCLTCTENAVLDSMSAPQQQIALFEGWTCKEAYLKGTGEGLSGLAHVEVFLTPAGSTGLRVANDADRGAGRWSLQRLELPFPGFKAALAVEGHDWQLTQIRDKPCTASTMIS